jgi:Cgr1 family
VKARTWEERIEKEKKESAIKKLEQEMKEEKKAEITRYFIFIGLVGWFQVYFISGVSKSQLSARRLHLKDSNLRK